MVNIYKVFIVLLIGAPCLADPFVSFDSRGMGENHRSYEFSVGNSFPESSLELGFGVDSNGFVSLVGLASFKF